jgi:osomolarity two-component system response regulator SKN7
MPSRSNLDKIDTNEPFHRMLEDPSYSSVVRWGDDGDSFVVLENEKFTKSILPKHFKHSNFASFVRQLNKYDFHKVRQNNEEGVSSIYGANAWEFHHPEFKANSKDSLDNIRRKAPAPRKPSQLNDDQLPTQQLELMSQQLIAQAQQIESLSARYEQLAANHQMMFQEVLRVQKTVLNHEHVIQDVMTFLHSVDQKQRRDSKTLFAVPGSAESGPSTLTPTSQNNIIPGPEDEAASPLQHATKLLSDLNADVQFNIQSLEQMQQNVHSPMGQPNGHARANTSAGSSAHMGYTKLEGGLDQVVYPMGTNNGIDPMYSEHVNNIPYPMPSKELGASDPRRQYADGRKKSGFADPGWARPPRILLVEDDPTCRQIGGKFLYSFCCVIDTALDGLEAVSKMQEGVKYDMILMDIIMPNLDGVSACHIIRQFDRTPIVAMTSNIRSDDIQMYFQHGMDDVLPKPFTRKSLLDMLEKHLIHLKKGPIGMDPPAPQQAIGAPSIAQSHTSATQSIRDDISAATSPAGSTGTWNSPSQYQGLSPIHPNMNQYAPVPHQTQYVDANGNPSNFHGPTTPVGGRPPGLPPQQVHRRGPSEMSGGAEGSANKRQRMMAAPMGR